MAEKDAPCPCGHPADDHDDGACMHLCDCAWPSARVAPRPGIEPGEAGFGDQPVPSTRDRPCYFFFFGGGLAFFAPRFFAAARPALSICCLPYAPSRLASSACCSCRMC